MTILLVLLIRLFDFHFLFIYSQFRLSFVSASPNRKWEMWGEKHSKNHEQKEKGEKGVIFLFWSIITVHQLKLAGGKLKTSKRTQAYLNFKSLQMLKVYIGSKSDKPMDEKSWAVLNAKLWKLRGEVFLGEEPVYVSPVLTFFLYYPLLATTKGRIVW